MAPSKIVVMAGASGVVGAQALTHLLARGDVQRVVTIGRRPLPSRGPKHESKVADLLDADALAEQMPLHVDAAICSLGTTIKQAGSQAAFRAVHFDAVVAFARAARQRGATRFVLVSSLGARATSRTFYLRVKGEVEEAVQRLGFAHVIIVRPSAIDDQGARTEFRMGERLLLPILRVVFTLVGRTGRYAPVPASVIGRSVARLALEPATGPVQIVESEALHRLGNDAIDV